MLTELQKHEFETFGFLLLKDFIPRDEMQIYIDAFDETMTKANGGVPWDREPEQHHVRAFYQYNPTIYHQMLDHEKINGVVEDLLGQDYAFWAAEGWHRWGGTGWHHDSVAPEGQTHLKFTFFLEPVGADTGALRMLPCSHFLPMRQRMEEWYGGMGVGDYANWPASVTLESNPGDAVIFNIKTYHAAFGEKADRRVIYINYIQHPQTPQEQDYIISNYDSIYTPELFEDATPKRMRMLAFIKEHCYDSDRGNQC